MNKEIKEPSAAEMAEFTKQFSKAVWQKLCKNKKFLKLVDTDLKACQAYADEFIKKFNL